MNDPPEISAYKCAGNMLINLRAGVTTFRDLGMNKTNLFAKQAVAQGIFPGPRLLVCGEAIIQTGGHTYWCCREASGADEMRRAVREQVRGGADLIKIMACHDTLEFTDEELAAVVDETHRNGLTLTAHATFDACINRCVRVRRRRHRAWRQHERRDHRAAGREARFRSSRPSRRSSCRASPRSRASSTSRNGRSRNASGRSPTRAAIRVSSTRPAAGVIIAFGTDCGSPAVAHNVIAPELAFMVKVGVKKDAYDAIRSATIVAAQVSKLDDEDRYARRPASSPM